MADLARAQQLAQAAAACLGHAHNLERVGRNPAERIRQARTSLISALKALALEEATPKQPPSLVPGEAEL